MKLTDRDNLFLLSGVANVMLSITLINLYDRLKKTKENEAR